MNWWHSTIDVGELVIKHTNSERLLSTGLFARWSMQI